MIPKTRNSFLNMRLQKMKFSLKFPLSFRFFLTVGRCISAIYQAEHDNISCRLTEQTVFQFFGYFLQESIKCFISCKSFCFISGLTHSLKLPRLEILPVQEVQKKPVGKPLMLTCRPDVPDANLITDLRWRDNTNMTILPKV